MQPQKITFILKSFNYLGLVTDSRRFQIILKRPTLPFFLARAYHSGRELFWKVVNWERCDNHFCSVLFVDKP